MSRTPHQLLALVEALERFKAMTVSNSQAQFWRRHQIRELMRLLEWSLSGDGAKAVIAAGNIPMANTRTIEEARLRIIKHFLAESRQEVARGNHGIRTRARRWNKSPASMSDSGKNLVVDDINLRSMLKSGYVKAMLAFAALCIWTAYFRPFAEQRIVNVAPEYHEAIAGSLWLATAVIFMLFMFRLGAGFSAILKNLIAHKPNGVEKGEHALANSIAGAFVAGVIVIVVLLVFDYRGHQAATAPFLGTYGDFFGGVLNPLLTFGTLLALGITIMMQRTQLLDAKDAGRDSIRVSNLQTFETTFFNLLNLHGATTGDLRFSASTFVSSISAKKRRLPVAKTRNIRRAPMASAEVRGRSVFSEIVKTMHVEAGMSHTLGWAFNLTHPEGIYRVIQERHNGYVGHYFRNLYQILSFVHEYRVRLSDSVGENEYSVRKRYTNMLRAQLSAHELTVLFFNCLDNMVDDGEFRELLIEYEFLEHMPVQYVYERHELVIKGYDDSITLQALPYLEFGDGRMQPGAFGTNSEIVKYLTMWRLRDDA